MSPGTARPLHGSGGFSLLELLVIVVIIASLAVIAAPRYAVSLARYRADAAARRIAADLRLARATARGASASVTVTFDIADDAYEMAGVQDLDDPSDAAAVVLSQEPYVARLDAANFGGDPVVVFDGFGVPDSGGQVVVASGAEIRTVLLDADSGLATVQ